jgi:hypothetical protein
MMSEQRNYKDGNGGGKNFDSISLARALEIWKEEHLCQGGEQDHPTDEQLTGMAADGGLERAEPSLIDHLSLCPACLAKWAAVVRAQRENRQAADDYLLACGMREAAATHEEKTTPSSMTSECGRFILGIYPDQENPRKCMVTLEVDHGLRETLEDRTATIRCGNGPILLQGRLRGGRLSRIFEDITTCRLDSWTLEISPDE